MPIDNTQFSRTKHTALKADKDHITFLFDFRYQGRRYRKQHTTNKAHTKADRIKTALAALNDYRDEVKKRADNASIDYDSTVDAYWQKLSSVKQWSDIIRYKHTNYYNKHIKQQLGNVKLTDLRPSHFTNLNVTLSHLAISTQTKAYEILRPLIALAIEDELLQTSPIKQSHKPKRNQLQEKRIVTLAVEKYRTLHNTITSLYADNPHHRAIFLFGFHGRRFNEVITLEWDDIDFKNNLYRIKAQNNKVKSDMTYTLPLDVREALLQFQDTTGKVFHVTTVQRHLKHIREHSQIPEFSYHWMRNLSVSALSAMGVDSMTLSGMLGHTDSGTLKKYLSLQRANATQTTNEASQKLLEGH